MNTYNTVEDLLRESYWYSNKTSPLLKEEQQEAFYKFYDSAITIKKLEDDRVVYMSTNDDLKSSLYTVKDQLERREDDLSKLTDKLVELEDELESK